MAIDLNELAAAISRLTIRFRFRRNTAADWAWKNEILLSSEAGYETDTGKMKIGDGVTPWNTLEYWGGGSGSGGGLTSDNAGFGISITTELEGGSDGTGGNPEDDPYWDNVSLLLPFEGADGASIQSDYGPLGLTVRNMGTTKLDALQTKFHTTSSDHTLGGVVGWQVDSDNSLNFGAGDWTVEGWYFSKHEDHPSTQHLWGKWRDDETFTPRGIYFTYDFVAGPTLYITKDDETSFNRHWIYPDFGAVPWNDDAWHFVQMVRDGDVARLYIDGLEWAVDYVGGSFVFGADLTGVTIIDTDVSFSVGNDPQGSSSWLGWLEDFRVTKGIARPNAVPTDKMPSLGGPVIPPTPVLKITNTMPGGGGGGSNLDLVLNPAGSLM